MKTRKMAERFLSMILAILLTFNSLSACASDIIPNETEADTRPVKTNGMEFPDDNIYEADSTDNSDDAELSMLIEEARKDAASDKKAELLRLEEEAGEDAASDASAQELFLRRKMPAGISRSLRRDSARTPRSVRGNLIRQMIQIHH